MTDMIVANTILAQLAGNIRRLSVMIGAHSFTADESSVTFKFRARAKNGSNCCRITLKPSDTYTVEFLSIRSKGVKVKESLEDIYAESLRPVFERHTGLYVVL